MHELSLCQSIVSISDSCAKDAGASRILVVTLGLGKAMAVEPKTLDFCFDIVSKGTRAEGAELKINWVPMKLKCRRCGYVYFPSRADVPEACPSCEAFDTECLEGREFYVKDIEVDD